MVDQSLAIIEVGYIHAVRSKPSNRGASKVTAEVTLDLNPRKARRKVLAMTGDRAYDAVTGGTYTISLN